MKKMTFLSLIFIFGILSSNLLQAQNKKLNKLNKYYTEKNYEDCYLAASDYLESEQANKADFLMFKVASFTALNKKHPLKVDNKDWLLTALDYLLQSKTADLDKNYMRFYQKTNKKVQKKAYQYAEKLYKNGEKELAYKYFDKMYQVFDNSNKAYTNNYRNTIMNADLDMYLKQKGTSKTVADIYTKYPKFKEWDNPKYRMLNTAESYYCPDTEKHTILLLNMMKVNPNLFRETYLKLYSDLTKTKDEALNSLLADFKTLKPQAPMQPDETAFKTAVCFAKESGNYDLKDHERISCPQKMMPKECLIFLDSEAPSACEVVFELLHDKNSKDAKYRKNALSASKKIGLSIQNHVSYKKVVVIDFAD